MLFSYKIHEICARNSNFKQKREMFGGPPKTTFEAHRLRNTDPNKCKATIVRCLLITMPRFMVILALLKGLKESETNISFPKVVICGWKRQRQFKGFKNHQKCVQEATL